MWCQLGHDVIGDVAEKPAPMRLGLVVRQPQASLEVALVVVRLVGVALVMAERVRRAIDMLGSPLGRQRDLTCVSSLSTKGPSLLSRTS